jgi:hypothetical protein
MYIYMQFLHVLFTIFGALNVVIQPVHLLLILFPVQQLGGIGGLVDSHGECQHVFIQSLHVLFGALNVVIRPMHILFTLFGALNVVIKPIHLLLILFPVQQLGGSGGRVDSHGKLHHVFIHLYMYYSPFLVL